MPRLLVRLTLLLLALTLRAHAVIVQGKVTSPFGRPVAGARIQLIDLRLTRSVANAVSGVDGTYEIRTNFSGRFLLLTSSAYFAPQIGTAFYAGRTNLITREIALNPASLFPLESTLPGGMPTPLAQLSAHLSPIPADRLLTRAFLANELPLAPATLLSTSAQTGQPAALFVRGAPADALAVLLDGQPIQRLGGHFRVDDFASTGIAAIASEPAVELLPDPSPAFSLAAQAGILALHTVRAANTRPSFVYSGDAGNFNTWRDEAEFALTHTRTDLFAAFSRFDTSNALPNNRFHAATGALNLGYHISAETSLRFTLRNQDAAAPLPIPYDLGLRPDTKDATQDLYGTFSFETRTARGWHNLLRYGMVRSREETFAYTNPSGGPVTLTGANGNSVTGQATPFPIPARQDQATTRDEISYETDYTLNHYLGGVFSARYQDERGLNAIPTFRQTLDQTNLLFALTLRGEIKHRFFYDGSGSLAHNPVIGFTGTPRLGLTYAPVLSGSRRLKGTTLHLTVATGNRERSLPEQAQSIVTPARSRTVDLSGDQNLYRQKLILHAGYFHNQFSHQTEVLSLYAPISSGQAGIGPVLSGSQAFRAQGFASELRYQPLSRLLIQGGYTYLASLVERSGASGLISSSYPATPVGLTTALRGQRPFQRPPHSGFFAVQYTGKAISADLQSSLASRADDSTLNPTLLLPNYNLDHGYMRLDAGFSYAVLRHFTVYSQLENLLNNQHMGPIGYPSTPFTVRAGLKIHFGGE